MKSTKALRRDQRVLLRSHARQTPGLLALGLLCAASLLLAMTAPAQTVTLTPKAPASAQNYWAGESTSNSLPTRTIAVALGGGAANINLALTGANGTTVFGTLSPNNFTNNGDSTLSLAVTNAAKGVYPLTINATGDAVASTNFNLHVVPQWARTNVGSSGNWSDNTKWSGGVAPLSTDSVYIERNISGTFTNVVDTSRTIQSLIYLGDADDGASSALALVTSITPGQTLSVLGTNGFFIGKRNSSSTRPVYTFTGGNLIVSNSAATFGIQDANPNATRYIRADMSGLDNLYIDVSRVAIADATLRAHGPQSANLVDWRLGRTNVIRATYTGVYTGTTFDTAISYMRQIQSANNGQSGNAQIRLGTVNEFYADSVGIGIGNANGSGSSAFSSTIGYRMVFASPDNAAPTSSVKFRNADGVSRMSLLALGVDQGTNTAITDNRGIMDLQGGRVDMLVDQIWLGQNLTDSANENGKDAVGGLYFNWGTNNCNTLIAGNMKFTNNHDGVFGYVIVGTNGLLVVNSNLSLGLTPADVTGFESQAANTGGRLRVDNGGTIMANQIDIGGFSANNTITLNAGASLVVSNKVAASGSRLGTLDMNGSQLTLFITDAGPYVSVTNLNTGPTKPVINIGSVSVLTTDPQVIDLISYEAAASTPSVGLGTLPAGYSGYIGVNPISKLVQLTISTNTPKTLVWRGYVNGTWDTTTPNWQDVNTLVQTTFGVNDTIIFDDDVSVTQTNLSVPADVVPGPISMTNSTRNYTFSGAGILRGSELTKAGTGSLTLNNAAEFSVAVVGGTLNANATVGAVNASSGTVVNIGASGLVNGSFSSAGLVVNAGNVSGPSTFQSSSVLTNSGTMDGGLSIQTGVYLFNDVAGKLTSIGSPTVPTNSTLVNNGFIRGLNLSVNGLLFDSGIGSFQMSEGTLTINGGGTFIPGGNGIGTTTVTLSNALGDNIFTAGAVKFLTGSTNVFKINVAGATYTKVLANAHVFGPNQSTKAFNGGTLMITNVSGSPFAAGQTFKLFGNLSDGPLFNLGENTTNSYPVMDPPTPGFGLAWDLSNLIPGGTIGVIGVPITPTNIASSIVPTTLMTTNSTNAVVIFDLSWPSEYTGWRLESSTAALTNGLVGATNWTTVFDSVWTNQIVITNSTSAADVLFYRLAYP